VDIVREQVRIGPLGLPGSFEFVAPGEGLVVFAHGSGSSRWSPRNQRVAEVLHQHRLSTLMFDLLTPDEASDRHKVFDIELLACRVGHAMDWVRGHPALGDACLGLFGASTGAAAALCAAASWPNRVVAVVSRGGRPDLASADLQAVQAPTLLIVGSRDPQVLALNRSAMRLLHCEKRLEVVPGATHLFEEPGALDTVAHLAGAWFSNHFSTAWRS
jgi:putative phosphoribosyl transferase